MQTSKLKDKGAIRTCECRLVTGQKGLEMGRKLNSQRKAVLKPSSSRSIRDKTN